LEGDRSKGCCMDVVRCSWVSRMEICNHFRSITKVVPIFPAVVFYSVAFPFDQILQFPPEHPTVQHFFYNVLFFAVNKFWWWWWSPTPSDNGVWWSRSQLNNVEDWVEPSHGVGKHQAVSEVSNRAFDSVGTKAAVREFH